MTDIDTFDNERDKGLDMDKINFDALDFPRCDTPEEARKRLDVIYTDLLAKKGISNKPDKNSPGFRPSPEQARQVAVLACLGLSAEDIALACNVETPVLKLYYTRELRIQHNMANALVARQALSMALDGRHADMTKFWLKSRAGWRETAAIELTGANGGPVEISSAKERLKIACGINEDGSDPDEQ